ncbi:phage terminase small subunit P27 family [Mycobacterium marinum]|uniref:phage terminase small subunit P27 family n=1 Tax=Mycobacterium marinum TaxID=1781 RepID=UPI0023582048|nr:phage terminase small subunit P27 family [Mycobacterium marinum]MDC8981248.1 phage terminase small subunit P27 family [Mycobacterium marinum]
MARPSQPAQLKLLKGRGNGTDSGGRKVPTPPKFTREAPDPPDWLDGEALAEWRRVVPELDRMNLIKALDGAALAVYCATWSTYVDAVQQIRRDGLVLTNPTSGRVHANPAAAIAHTAAAQLLRFAVEFGLTPSAEQRLAALPVDSGDADDPFAAG